MNITREKLLDLLGRAFEDGWSGYHDLKAEVIHRLADEAERQPEATFSAFPEAGVRMDFSRPNPYESGEGFILETPPVRSYYQIYRPNQYSGD
jgi:hypothetical protein